MTKKKLRSSLIRLAHEKPELRPDLLPLLKVAKTRTKKRFMDLLKEYGPHPGRKAPWNLLVQMVMERWERWSDDDFDDPADQLDWQYLYNAAYAIGWGMDTGRFPTEIETKITSLTPTSLLNLIATVATEANTIDAAKGELYRRLS